MEWEAWKGKKVFIKLLSGDFYNGVVLDADNSFLEINDKYGNEVRFAVSQIAKIVDETNGN